MGGAELARSDRAAPPWSRFSPSVENVTEELEERIALDRNLPVLLGPEDEISIEDMEAMVDDVTSGSFIDKGFNARLHEVGKLVDEFQLQKFGSTASEEVKVRKPPEVMETLNAVSEKFKNKINNSTPLLDQIKYTEKDIPKLRERWLDTCKDIMGGVPEEIPPLREVNHTIPLIDESIHYRLYRPRCPDSLRTLLTEKIARYTRAGWWKPMSVGQASPMLCLPKKDGGLRTTIDCRERNANTFKDVTPLPDQDALRMDVARRKIRSKIDLSDAYEQVRVVAEDVWKTAFSTVQGTFVSTVLQQGDCNGPSTFQRLMNTIFRDYIGVFMHVYIDDIFVFSDTVEEHEQHLQIVFDTLRKQHLFLKASKCELYAAVMDCMGHVIDDKGLHADADKLAKIREWRQPRNYNDVQKFLGLVNYLAHFLPDVTAYTNPLSEMSRNNQPFFWRPVHDLCFERIKNLCCKVPILRPIDPRLKIPIWVVCDASVSGVGALYGQGESWQTCRPAGFMSKKFSDAQRNYRVFECEMLAILEALLKWEDKLIGYKINVVTDHEALTFFQTQRKLSSRQMRWMEYLARFDIEITYIKGVTNKVADVLSRYYESDNEDEQHAWREYVNADARLDKLSEDLPLGRKEEIIRRAEQMMARREARDQVEPRELEAETLEQAREPEIPVKEVNGPNPTILESRNNIAGKTERIESDPEFLEDIRKCYETDTLFTKVLTKPIDHPRFDIKDGLIWTENLTGEKVLCIPESSKGMRSLRGAILEQGHHSVGHFGPQRTADYVRRWYWWPRIYSMCDKFCRSCEHCHRAKAEYRAPAGKLHNLPIPSRPWESIGMDFIGPFPEMKGYNYLWVVICRLTSQVHLIPCNTRDTATDLSLKYMQEIVRLHGLPASIVSDRDPKFTSTWWRELHRLLGSKLLMSTSFHPQTDGATERANRSIAQIFRSAIRADQHDWLVKIPYVEFALNSSRNESTGYAPFELTYGYMPSMMFKIENSSELLPGIRAFGIQAIQSCLDAHDAIIEARVFQTHQANKKRRAEPDIQRDSLVYLSTKNLNLPKGRASKLLPKFVGPYRVEEAYPETSNYVLDLPDELKGRRLHDKFHVSLLRPYVETDAILFPNRSKPEPYDFGAPPDAEEFVDSIRAHVWKGKKVFFEVWWSLGDVTLEPYDTVKKLKSLDDYFATQSVSRWQDLSKSKRPS